MAAPHPGIEQLRQELGAVDSRLTTRLDGFEARVDQRFGTIDERFDAIDERLATVLGHIDATAAETRRHFDVIAETLRSTVRLVADGVARLDEKVERFRDETRESFERVDRRFLRLDVRVSALERR